MVTLPLGTIWPRPPDPPVTAAPWHLITAPPWWCRGSHNVNNVMSVMCRVCVCAVLTVGPSLMPPKLPHSDFYTHKRNASFPSTDRWHLNRCLNLTRARSLPVPVFLLLRVTKQQATLALDCGFWSDSLNTKCLWRSGRCLPQCPVHCILFAGARLCNLDLSPRPRLQDHTFQCFVWPDLTLHSPCLPSPSTRLIILVTWHGTRGGHVTRLSPDSDPGMSRGMRPRDWTDGIFSQFPVTLQTVFNLISLSPHERQPRSHLAMPPRVSSR